MHQWQSVVNNACTELYYFLNIVYSLFHLNHTAVIWGLHDIYNHLRFANKKNRLEKNKLLTKT